MRATSAQIDAVTNKINATQQAGNITKAQAIQMRKNVVQIAYEILADNGFSDASGNRTPSGSILSDDVWDSYLFTHQ